MSAVETTPAADVWQAFGDVVHGRKSVRFYQRREVPRAVMREVFDLARWCPSNCNSQPWRVIVASGGTMTALREALAPYVDAEVYPADIPYNPEDYTPPMRERQIDHVVAQQLALGIARDDPHARRGLKSANLAFFGAPHAAFLFMPAFSNEREAADMGMYAQTLMLGLTARGLASVPQTSIGMYAAPVKQVLNVGPELKLMFAVSFGYEDASAPGARLDQTRAELSEAVDFRD